MKTDFFQNRKYLIIGFIVACVSVIIVKLLFMQVVNDKYKFAAENNYVKERQIYPARGDILDRNGNLMVCSEVVYDLTVIPKHIDSTFNVEEFCQLVDVDTATFNKSLEKCRKYSRSKASVIVSQISKDDISVIQESLYKYPAFDVVTRTVRKYPHKSGALFLGDVGEVSSRVIQRNPDKYVMGDYHGIAGLENTYEDYLRGSKGKRFVLVNARNVEIGSYNDGLDDVNAVQGSNLILEIDVDLQNYGEKLMQGKRGCIVAIDPKTGGILTMVSAPTFDPNLLVGRRRAANYTALVNDTANIPLLNRAIMGEYPPGSTLKTFNGLVALQEKAISRWTRFDCHGPESSPMKCTHYHTSPLDVVQAIRESCNPFFRKAFENLISQYDTPQHGLQTWRDYACNFGFGAPFNTDIYSEKGGYVPTTEYYDKYYGRKGWKASTVRSLSIGQGEVLVTPIQLANLAAAIGNDGYYIKPHLVKAIVDRTTDSIIFPFADEIVRTNIDKTHFATIKDGMRQMITKTNSSIYADIKNIEFCGKTGTVQNSGKDHALFIGFAPKDNPEIAIAVVVENSGFGSTYALPVASLMVEYYINDSISQSREWIENKVLNTITLD